MSNYPNNNPALSMNDIWTSGDYTPPNICRGIIDNHTPINKNAIINSLGEEISAVQNFVNNKFLGRASLPVASGFFTDITVGNTRIYDAGGGYSNIQGSGTYFDFKNIDVPDGVSAPYIRLLGGVNDPEIRVVSSGLRLTHNRIDVIGNIMVSEGYYINSPILTISGEGSDYINLTMSGDGLGNGEIYSNGGISFRTGATEAGSPSFGIDIEGKIKCNSGVVFYNDAQFTTTITSSQSGVVPVGDTDNPFGDVYATGLILQDILSYANNASALSAGAKVGTVYRSGDYLCVVH
jgi:hypothetical protein